jgi:hypothetical protein
MIGKLLRPSRAFMLLMSVLILLASTVSRAQETAGLYGKLGVTASAVRQGTLGSCYFHATIAALARANPQALQNAISSVPDASYRVRFVDGPEESVYPVDIEFGRQHSFDHSDGDWVLVLMRGYAQRALRQSLVESVQKSTFVPFFARPILLSMLNQSGYLLVAYDRAIRAVVNQEGELDKTALKQKLAAQLSLLGIPSVQADMLGGFLDEKGFFDQLGQTVKQNGEVFGAYRSMSQGGIPMNVLEAFTGNSKAGLIADSRALPEQLHDLHSGRVAMVVGSFANPSNSTFPREHEDWFVPGHCYTAIDYEEATQSIVLRNPWGKHPDPDGTFTLPLPVFIEGFQFFASSRIAPR